MLLEMSFLRNIQQIGYLLNGNGVTGLGTKIVELLDHTLFAIGVLS